jgi:hypothetical protein
MCVHKKIPGVFDSARDMFPVAHHDGSTLLGTYTHATAVSRRCSSGHDPSAFQRQGTTRSSPPAERNVWTGLWSSAKAMRGGQTVRTRMALDCADPVRSKATAGSGLRKALCMGGVFAVSTVLPEKIQHLASHLETIRQLTASEVLEDSFQVLGCFLVLSVLIWASRSEPRPVKPLLAYPPHNSETVIVHITGLVLGVVLMLI